MIKKIAVANRGDPIVSCCLHNNTLITGSILGAVTTWDIRSSSSSPVRLTDLAKWNDEGIRGLSFVNERIHAIVGDRCVFAWSLEKEDEPMHRIDFQRPHNPTVCGISYCILGDQNKIFLLTQGQTYCHFMDLNTRRQESVLGLGCPWYTVPCHYRGRHLLWREHLVGPNTCVSKGKTGDVQRLRIWDVETPAEASIEGTLTIKSDGGFKLFGNSVTSIHGKRIRMYNSGNGSLCVEMSGHSKQVKALDVTNECVVSIADDRVVKWWEETGSCSHTVQMPKERTQCYSVDMTQVVCIDSKNALISTGDSVYLVTR